MALSGATDGDFCGCWLVHRCWSRPYSCCPWMGKPMDEEIIYEGRIVKEFHARV